MSEADLSDRRLQPEAKRASTVAILGLIGALILTAFAGWPRSTISSTEAVATGLCLGFAEAGVLVNAYLWLARRISASRRWQNARIPRKTAGWIWAAYQGTALPLTAAQHRLRRGELGTLLALVLITGQELLLRSIQAGLTPIHSLLGMGFSIALAIALAISPGKQPCHSLFAVSQGALTGLVHASAFMMTGSLAATVTAAATSYLVLKRL